MPSRNFSLMIVDEDREVRECLGELFLGSGYDVSLVDSTTSALESLPAQEQASWPDVIILGQEPQKGYADAFLSRARTERPGLAERASLIVFSSFRVPLGTGPQPDRRYVQACRLSTVSNLITLVHGLAQRQSPPVGADA